MPLAHILAPQLALKAQEIEDELGHAPVGYLEDPRAAYARKVFGSQIEQQSPNDLQEAPGYSNERGWYNTVTGKRSFPEAEPPKGKKSKGGYLKVGYEKTPYDPRGLMNKPESKSFDPRDMMAGGGMQSALGTFQRSGDLGQRAFAKGALLGMDDKFLRGYIRKPYVPIVEPKKTTKGKSVISAKPGEPIGIDENGQAVDIRGKKLGYLNAPAVATLYGNTPLRTGERKPGDVFAEQRDPFARSALEQKYKKHLEEVEFNNGKFPAGYFKKMSAEEKSDIQKGVQALQAIRREDERGGPMI